MIKYRHKRQAKNNEYIKNWRKKLTTDRNESNATEDRRGLRIYLAAH